MKSTDLLQIKDFVLTKTKMNMMMSHLYEKPMDILKIVAFIDFLNDYYYEKYCKNESYDPLDCFSFDNYIKDMNEEIKTNDHGFKDKFITFINTYCPDYNNEINEDSQTSLNILFNNYNDFVRS